MLVPKILRKVKIRGLSQDKKQQAPPPPSGSSSGLSSVSSSLEKNLQTIQEKFAGTSDLIIREFTIGSDKPIKAFVVMIAGLVNEVSVNENLMKPLLFLNEINHRNAITLVKESPVSVARLQETRSIEAVVDAILSGDTALFIEGSDTALIASLRGWEARGVDEPKTEAVVRGPREGFVETLGTNMALLRRKIKNPNLKFEQMTIGKQTKTTVCIAYIQGIVNPKIVEEVRNRLKRIDTDAILESGYIEQLIEDAPISLFPTVGNTEKPDVISAKLLEGRVAILVDGTPFALAVPYLFIESFQNSEDYYSRPFYATFIRLIRWLAFFFTTFLPGLYVAVTTFHQEFLPPALLTSIAAAQEGTPFPSVLEALIMQTVYEILREAGVRLPRPVGQAVSIVGALVIGEAAVSAGLVGAPMVVVTALTAISSFVVSPLTDVSTLIRFSLIILAGFSGFYGMMLGFIAFLTHQVSLRSFGVPYLSPLAPSTFSDLKDTLFRSPIWTMVSRPRVLGGKNPKRQKPNLMPTPPDEPKGEN